MPYDPNWPQHGEKLTSYQLHEQWNGVAALAAQVGPPGPAGSAGRGIANIRDNGDATYTITLTDSKPAGNVSDLQTGRPLTPDSCRLHPESLFVACGDWLGRFFK